MAGFLCLVSGIQLLYFVPFMNNLRKLTAILTLLIIFLLLVLGCADDPTCLEDSTDLVKIAFVDSVGTAKSVVFKEIDAIESPGAFPEYADSTLTTAILPLKADINQLTLLFRQDTITDTLALSYHASFKLLAPECGLYPEFQQLDTLFTTFSSLKIISRTIHPDIDVNIQISL